MSCRRLITETVDVGRVPLPEPDHQCIAGFKSKDPQIRGFR
jgi:hypothetical protein